MFNLENSKKIIHYKEVLSFHKIKQTIIKIKKFLGKIILQEIIGDRQMFTNNIFQLHSYPTFITYVLLYIRDYYDAEQACQ